MAEGSKVSRWRGANLSLHHQVDSIALGASSLTDETVVVGEQQHNTDPMLTQRHLRTIIFKSYIYYVEKFYPEINMSDICIEAGLSFEYLTDEDNWVSVIFEKKFMEALQKRIKDEDLLRRVGEFGVRKEVLGKTVCYLMHNIFTLRALYKNLPFMTSLFNKVIKTEIIEHRGNLIHYRVSPQIDVLNRTEVEVLLSRMSAYMSNIMGYYSAMPIPKGLQMSDVTLEELKGGAYSLVVRYPYEMRTWNLIDNAMVFLFFYVISFFMFLVPLGDYKLALYISFISSLRLDSHSTYLKIIEIPMKELRAFRKIWLR